MQMRTFWKKLDSVQSNARRIGEPFGTVLFSLPDLPAFIAQNIYRNLPLMPRCPPFYYGYPKPFKRRIFDLASGMRIDGVVAVREDWDSLIILVHGIFQSKNFKFIRDMAARLFEKHSVVVVDTRDHLGTFQLSPGFPASGGMLEGRDILEISKIMKYNRPSLRIFLIGFSYGGGIVLNALNSEDARGILSGVIAVSPTMVIEHAVAHIDTDPGFGSPFAPMYNLFQTCLRLRHGISIETFQEYLQKAAKEYGYTVDEMMRKSSLSSFMDGIRIPALLVIAKDDPVIPKGDRQRVLEMSKSNEFVKMKEMERGGHISFAFIDQKWFYDIIEEFAKA